MSGKPLWIVVLLAAGCGQSKPAEGTGVTKTPGPTSEHEATRLADLAGKLGQRVTLTGVVQAATTNRGAPFLILNWSTGSEVHCRFSASDQLPDWLAGTEPGQKLKVRGTLVNLQPGFAILNECEYLGSPR